MTKLFKVTLSSSNLLSIAIYSQLQIHTMSMLYEGVRMRGCSDVSG